MKAQGTTAYARQAGWGALLIAAMLLGGCAGASVTHSTAPADLSKPDVVVVNNFAVNAAEVKLDRGLMATAMRDAGNRSLSDEENKIGWIVADRLASSLVQELKSAGINAVRGGTVQGTELTAYLNGEFVTIDQGDQTKRTWVGFGLGGSELRTRIQVLQNGKLVAQGETATSSSMKPGMLVSLGAAGAVGSVVPIVVGGVSVGITEGMLSAIEADAKRTAKEIAKTVQQGYKQRGWLH